VFACCSVVRLHYLWRQNTIRILYYVFQNRSPEEYAYERQSEKVDIYSFGNVLYSVLTGLWPWKDIKDKSARKRIRYGERPEIPSSYRDSTNPFEQALLKLIDLSWIHEPTKRASARELQKFIISELERLGVEKD